MQAAQQKQSVFFSFITNWETLYLDTNFLKLMLKLCKSHLLNWI